LRSHAPASGGSASSCRGDPWVARAGRPRHLTPRCLDGLRWLGRDTALGGLGRVLSHGVDHIGPLQ
jgi:hypothetical protein